MVATAHDPRLFYAAVYARLISSTGKQIGQAVAPADVTTPYAVLYPGFDLGGEGGLSDPTQVNVWGFQVTGVGKTMDETTWMQHKIRVALLGWLPTVAGLGTTQIDLENGSGILRDDDVMPALFYSTDRFRMFSSS